ncbi:glycosyltransferase [bacterium]|nr:glycosyltransferase [bacterium]
MLFVINSGLLALGVYLAFYVFYSVLLVLVNFFIPERRVEKEKYQVRFVVIIPAHNEELFIKRILNSFRVQTYPAHLFQVIVVADNCNDNTADCSTTDNVQVLVRTSNTDFGKGYAIKYALENIAHLPFDAVLVIDADSIIEKNGLSALNQHILKGKKILQCNNAVANPEDSWFTLLMNVARTIGNEIMEPAKEKIGLSSHLMGNGMCFHKEIIDRYGWDSFSVGEDWEYFAKIINEGEKVSFAQDVHVFHQESTSLGQATPQRMRWASGRFEVLKKYGFGLLKKGIAQRSLVKFDASLPLLLPNPSLAINLTVLGFIFSLIPWIFNGSIVGVVLYAILAIVQVLIFIAAVFYTENKFKSFLSIFIAPLFLVWKMGIDILSFVGMGRKKWVRTERHL